MPKHEIKDERKVINSAIDHCQGFIDALEWVDGKSAQDILDQIEDTKYILEEYRERLHEIMLHEGRSKRKKEKHGR